MMACIQSATSTLNAASPAKLAFPSPNTAGNLLVLIGRTNLFSNTAGTPIVDTNGNQWVKVVNNNYTTTNDFFMAYALNCKGGANTVSVYSGGVITYSIAEYPAVGAFDVAASLSQTAANPTSGNITTSEDNELLIGGTFNAGITGAGTGYTLQQNSNNCGLEDKTAGTAGTYSATFTATSSTTCVGIMAFKAARTQAKVQTAGVGGTVQSPSIAFTNPVVGGNLLTILCVVQGSAVTCSSMVPTDTLQNVWTPVWAAFQSPTGGIIKFIQGWWCISKKSGANTVTMTTNAATIGNLAVAIGEFSGFHSAGYIAEVDQTVTSAGTGTAVSPLTFVRSKDRQIIFAFTDINTNQTAVPSLSGLTLGTDIQVGHNVVSAYAVTPTAGTTSLTGTWDTTSTTTISAGFSVVAGVPLVQNYYDNFTRANENPLNPGNWYTFGGTNPFKIVSNVVTPSASGSNSQAIFTSGVPAWPADQYSEITIGANPTGGNYWILLARALQNTYLNPVGSSYQAYIQGPSGSAVSILLRRYTNNTFTLIASATVTPQNGDVFRLTVVGNVISVSQNGVVIISFLDSVGTVGYPIEGCPGIYCFNPTTGAQTLSSWGGGSRPDANVMVTMVADTFTRANGQIGANWTDFLSAAPTNDLTIVSNQVQIVGGGNYAYYNAITWPNDCWASVRVPVIPTLGASTAIGVLLRCSGTVGSDNSFALFFYAGNLYIQRRTAGVFAGNYGPIAWTVLANDVLRLEIKGSALRAIVNNVLCFTATDANNATGSAGIVNQSAGKQDLFAGGVIVPAKNLRGLLGVGT